MTASRVWTSAYRVVDGRGADGRLCGELGFGNAGAGDARSSGKDRSGEERSVFDVHRSALALVSATMMPAVLVAIAQDPAELKGA